MSVITVETQNIPLPPLKHFYCHLSISASNRSMSGMGIGKLNHACGLDESSVLVVSLDAIDPNMVSQ